MPDSDLEEIYAFIEANWDAVVLRLHITMYAQLPAPEFWEALSHSGRDSLRTMMPEYAVAAQQNNIAEDSDE